MLDLSNMLMLISMLLRLSTARLQSPCASDKHVDELIHRAVALQANQAKAEYTSQAFVSAMTLCKV